MKKIILVIIILTSINSCTCNSISINSKADNTEGTAFLYGFYNAIRDKKYNVVDTMTSDTLKRFAGPNAIEKVLKAVNDKVGNYISHDVIDVNTRRISGSNNETLYNYKLKVAYEKDTLVEFVGLKREKESDIKLISYNVNFDMLKN